jgi:hypothetical protein
MIEEADLDHLDVVLERVKPLGLGPFSEPHCIAAETKLSAATPVRRSQTSWAA